MGNTSGRRLLAGALGAALAAPLLVLMPATDAAASPNAAPFPAPSQSEEAPAPEPVSDFQAQQAPAPAGGPSERLGSAPGPAARVAPAPRTEVGGDQAGVGGGQPGVGSGQPDESAAGPEEGLGVESGADPDVAHDPQNGVRPDAEDDPRSTADLQPGGAPQAAASVSPGDTEDEGDLGPASPGATPASPAARHTAPPGLASRPPAHAEAEPAVEVVPAGLINGDFEQGAAGWAGSTGAITHSGLNARSGSTKAHLGGKGYAHTQELSQSFVVPESGLLDVHVNVRSSDWGWTARDRMTLYVQTESGRTFSAGSWSNTTWTWGYRRWTVDMTSLIGEEVTVRFVATENNSRTTSFLVDDVSFR